MNLSGAPRSSNAALSSGCHHVWTLCFLGLPEVVMPHFLPAATMYGHRACDHVTKKLFKIVKQIIRLQNLPSAERTL